MPSDLPDYTQYVTHNINVPEASTGQVNVLRYSLVPVDLTDGARGPILGDVKGRIIVKVLQEAFGQLLADMRVRPKGGVKDFGEETTTSSYATISELEITENMSFHPSRIIISAETSAWVKCRWDGNDISANFLLDDITILVLHFPYDWETMDGDGSKKFDVQGKYNTEAGLLNVEISGEEVTT